MKDLIYVANMGILEVIEKIHKQRGELKNQNWGAGYVGKLMNKYFSLSGFYELDSINKKQILLKKLNPKQIPNTDYEMIDLMFPNDFFSLSNHVDNGTALVHGKVHSREFKGRIEKRFLNKHSISILEEL